MWERRGDEGTYLTGYKSLPACLCKDEHRQDKSRPNETVYGEERGQTVAVGDKQRKKGQFSETHSF